MYQFAERLFIKPAQERSGRPKRDWQPRMTEARFVGHHSRTQSIIGLTPDGVVYGHCAKSLPREDDFQLPDGIDYKDYHGSRIQTPETICTISN